MSTSSHANSQSKYFPNNIVFLNTKLKFPQRAICSLWALGRLLMLKESASFSNPFKPSIRSVYGQIKPWTNINMQWIRQVLWHLSWLSQKNEIFAVTISKLQVNLTFLSTQDTQTWFLFVQIKAWKLNPK